MVIQRIVTFVTTYVMVIERLAVCIESLKGRVRKYTPEDVARDATTILDTCLEECRKKL